MTQVSVVVVPRQRWSFAERSLDAVLQTLPDGVELVYVDGGSPAPLSARLEATVRDVGGVWVRRDCVLAGNEARNLGLAAASGDRIVFVDNDVIPHPGWIEALVRCADDTGAAAVGPVILIGRDATSTEVHSVDGDLEVADGVLSHRQHHVAEELDDVASAVGRTRSDQVEFHAILLRRDVIARMGGFDEQLRSMGDHEDVMLALREMGEEVWVEAAAVVVYLTMVPLEPDEVAYWQLRWSERWNRESIDRFTEKWGLAIDAGWPAGAAQWASAERTRWYHGHGRIVHHAGRAVRRAFNTPLLSDPTRRAEERLISRRGRHEVARRRSVLGHA